MRSNPEQTDCQPTDKHVQLCSLRGAVFPLHVQGGSVDRQEAQEHEN